MSSSAVGQTTGWTATKPGPSPSVPPWPMVARATALSELPARAVGVVSLVTTVPEPFHRAVPAAEVRTRRLPVLLPVPVGATQAGRLLPHVYATLAFTGRHDVDVVAEGPRRTLAHGPVQREILVGEPRRATLGALPGVSRVRHARIAATAAAPKAVDLVRLRLLAEDVPFLAVAATGVPPVQEDDEANPLTVLLGAAVRLHPLQGVVPRRGPLTLPRRPIAVRAVVAVQLQAVVARRHARRGGAEDTAVAKQEADTGLVVPVPGVAVVGLRAGA